MNPIALTGRSIVGGKAFEVSTGSFIPVSRITKELLEPAFHNAGAEVVDIAASFAAEAFKSFRNSTGAVRAKLLRNIADRLDNAKSEIVARAHHESGLPEARLNGEMGRTTGQLRMFATIAED